MNLHDITDDPKLLELKERLNRLEQSWFSPQGTLSETGKRRRLEERIGHRQTFVVDADRIMHSRAYTRYIDKTQVFYMVENDHITHRVLHVQLVSKIARTIGRFLGLNQDLIEAIALGHDIGHPPFGHDGEKILDEICRNHGLTGFQHNIQSVFALEHLEKKGYGINLCLQTLDGILCHDGEVHDLKLTPCREKSFADFDREIQEKARDRKKNLVPMTMEGCLVRLADTISYIGRDIEDAIELKLIRREEIPRRCRDVLGNTNGTIVYRLVTDLILHSNGQNYIGFSPAISECLKELKRFNYERIYLNPLIKTGFEQVKKSYRLLFENYLEHAGKKGAGTVFSGFLSQMAPVYTDHFPLAAMVKDFIAGMTDDYFLAQARKFGCNLPLLSPMMKDIDI